MNLIANLKMNIDRKLEKKKGIQQMIISDYFWLRLIVRLTMAGDIVCAKLPIDVREMLRCEKRGRKRAPFLRKVLNGCNLHQSVIYILYNIGKACPHLSNHFIFCSFHCYYNCINAEFLDLISYFIIYL